MAVARVDADAVFSLLTGAETERAFDRVGRRLTRRLTNGRFDTLYPAQREAAWQLTFGQNPVVAQLPTGKGKGAISLLWMCATGGVVLECVPLTSIGRGHVVEASKVAGWVQKALSYRRPTLFASHLQRIFSPSTAAPNADTSTLRVPVVTAWLSKPSLLLRRVHCDEPVGGHPPTDLELAMCYCR